jgi:heme oxygenase
MHREAERSGAVARLLRGDITRSAYTSLMRNLLPVYQQIEHGLDLHRDRPSLRPLAVAAVYRASAIASDLASLAGPDWQTTVPLLPEGIAYAGLIEHATETTPDLLIAHAYVRYLGDLNGGQVLQRRLATTLGLDDTALAFYRFDLIPDLATFRHDYRHALNTIRLDPTTTNAVVAEAQTAFQANIALSTAVASKV